jgi:hypothetical protein
VAPRKPTAARPTRHGIPTFARLVRESIAAGMTTREAEAHAWKIRAAFDLIEVDPRTGRRHFVTSGPSIVDLAKTPTRKRPKGKTR